ncbi:FliH/SctL family protein [Natranaerobius trueperi]|uniref:Flagellar assembly protein FliH/Type III secretion system HrpE domain-containing protein n=1 Tax=Natranaerobius trueperi TaxID=759412 RepID=A0A226C1D8_9FIRM|nr:FliH/SctL family protein [Natranaerobius trueperi]OWZ84227.1 hypothetical protein CDO51_03995 [Natranaerobius trueperi]
MSKVYKSDSLTPSSPFVWECKMKQSTNKNDGNGVNKSNAQSMTSNAMKDAEEIIKNAKKRAYEEANAIKEQAEKEKEQIFENAKKEGYQAGYEAGKNEGLQVIEEKQEELLQKAKKVVQAAEDDYCRLLSETEPQIVQLILNIARKVISTKLEEDKESIINLVKNGIEKLNDQKRVTIRANPEDYTLLSENVTQLKCNFKEIKIELVEDLNLQIGSPVLLGENGHIDLDIENQLEELHRSLKQVVQLG